MKYIIVLLLGFTIIACEDLSGSSGSSIAGQKPEPIVFGQTSLVTMANGDYVIGGSSHPTIGGDIFNIQDGSYVFLRWESGILVKEEGTVEFRQELHVEQNDQFTADIHTYTNYIVCHPTSYTPSHCGYSLDSYELEYVYEANGNILTQYVYLGDSERATQSAGPWPHNEAWADANLTTGCL